MLTLNELRRVAAQSGARDISKVEIDVILTYLLQLFAERGITEHAAFKGGTMLRKMVFGARGRLSTDLDFTRRTEIEIDDLMTMILDALNEPYRGLTFQLKDKDWYLTEDGCAANPACSHDDNKAGVYIKLQISTREGPILPVLPVAQLNQDYFKLLEFKPEAIPSLSFEEAIAEKIRAASQRSKIRDLHDLSEIAGRKFNRDLVRPLAVIKLWNSEGHGLAYERFSERVKDTAEYNVADLANLLRKDQRPDLGGMIRRAVEGFRFLANLTDAEKTLAADSVRANRKSAEELIQAVRALAA
jgi:predicted nucleotidyltransferase component of viral defense system